MAASESLPISRFRARGATTSVFEKTHLDKTYLAAGLVVIFLLLLTAGALWVAKWNKRHPNGGRRVPRLTVAAWRDRNAKEDEEQKGGDDEGKEPPTPSKSPDLQSGAAALSSLPVFRWEPTPPPPIASPVEVDLGGPTLDAATHEPRPRRRSGLSALASSSSDNISARLHETRASTPSITPARRHRSCRAVWEIGDGGSSRSSRSYATPTEMQSEDGPNGSRLTFSMSETDLSQALEHVLSSFEAGGPAGAERRPRNPVPDDPGQGHRQYQEAPDADAARAAPTADPESRERPMSASTSAASSYASAERAADGEEGQVVPVVAVRRAQARSIEVGSTDRWTATSDDMPRIEVNDFSGDQKTPTPASTARFAPTPELILTLPTMSSIGTSISTETALTLADFPAPPVECASTALGYSPKIGFSPTLGSGLQSRGPRTGVVVHDEAPGQWQQDQDQGRRGTGRQGTGTGSESSNDRQQFDQVD